MLLFFANVVGAKLQVRGEAQALRAEMETQRTRATQLEQLFQQQVNGRPLALAFTILEPPHPLAHSLFSSHHGKQRHCCLTGIVHVHCPS